MNPAPDDSQIDRLWHELRAHVRQSVPDDHQADDVVQESWLRTIETPLPRIEKLPAWLRVVARHLIIESIRTRRGRLERERAVARPDVAPPTDTGVLPGESAVLRLVAELPEPYRRVVRLRYLEDWTVAEIARHEERTESTVRSQIKRGLDRLRVRLQVKPARKARGGKRTIGLAWWSQRSARPVATPAMAWIAAGVLGALLGGLGWVAIADDARAERARGLDTVATSPAEATPPSAVLSDDVRTRVQHGGLAARAPMPLGSSGAPPSAPPITGRVVLRPTGAAIPGARVRGAASLDDPIGIELDTSDAGGRFKLAPPALPMWIWAEHDGYSATARAQVDEAFRASGRELLLRSVSEGRVRVEVVDESSRPIANAQIFLGEAWDVAPARSAQLLYETVPPPQLFRTGSDGSVDAPIPHNGWLRVTAVDFAERWVMCDTQSATQRIALARSEASSVAPARSSSPSPVRATARWSGSLAAPAPGIELRVKSGRVDTWTPIAVDASGRFASGPLPAGEHELVASSADSHGAWLVQRARLCDGEHFETHGIELPELGGVLVRVRTPAGESVNGPSNIVLRGIATATAVHHNDLGNAVQIDRAAKTVEIARIWPGSYEIVLRGAGLRETVVPLEVRAGLRSEIDVEMESGYTVFVRVNAARPLAEGERLEAFFDTPRGNVPVAQLNAIHPVSLEPLTTFNAGAPLDARRLVVQTSTGHVSSGLYGELDLAPLAQKQGSRITISMSERPPALAPILPAK